MSKKRARAKKAKRSKATRCEICGESDAKFVPIVIQVDGKVWAKWRACKACCAEKTVLLMDHRRHR